MPKTILVGVDLEITVEGDFAKTQELEEFLKNNAEAVRRAVPDFIGKSEEVDLGHLDDNRAVWLDDITEVTVHGWHQVDE